MYHIHAKGPVGSAPYLRLKEGWADIYIAVFCERLPGIFVGAKFRIIGHLGYKINFRTFKFHMTNLYTCACSDGAMHTAWPRPITSNATYCGANNNIGDDRWPLW